MNDVSELKDLIARTAQAKFEHLRTGTGIIGFLYENQYRTPGRRAYRPRGADLPGSNGGHDPA